LIHRKDSSIGFFFAGWLSSLGAGLLVLTSVAGLAQSSGLRAGSARIDITPPLQAGMSGPWEIHYF
jgi:hypothetical protein